MPLTREGRAALGRAALLGAGAGCAVAGVYLAAKAVVPGSELWVAGAAGGVAFVWLWWYAAPRPARSSR